MHVRSPVLRIYLITSAGLSVVAVIVWAILDAADLVVLLRAILICLTIGGMAALIAHFVLTDWPSTAALRLGPVAPDRRKIVRRAVTTQATEPISGEEADAGLDYAEAFIDVAPSQDEQMMTLAALLAPSSLNGLLGSPGPLLTALHVVTLLLLLAFPLLRRRRARLLANAARFIESRRGSSVGDPAP